MRIEHIALYVKDLDKARDFFIQYFDGHAGEAYYNQTTEFRSYFVRFHDGTRLEIMNKPDLDDSKMSQERTGYAHIAFSVGSRENVDKLTAKIKRDGYKVISGPRITGDGYYESCILAVEGNQIEITV